MKICIPTMGERGFDEQISEHFGMSPTFTIVDTITNEITIIKNSSDHMGGFGHPPELIRDSGADIVICRGLGKRANRMLKSFNIKVYGGAIGLVKDAIELWNAHKLFTVGEESTCNNPVCDHEHNENNQ